MSRDKSDTLLLLIACAMVLGPHALHLPAWISSLCAALLLWRGWITFRGNRLPSRWVLLPLVALIVVVVHSRFGTWFGRDAGVAMLSMLLGLKLLEMHARSDLWVVILLNYFLILAQFFYSQTVAAAAMTAAGVIALLCAQLSFQYTGKVPPLRTRIVVALKAGLLALPVAAALFVLFPRIQGPLWGMPKDARGARTGLSEEMTPGNISQLAESDEIVFRVKFEGTPPPKSSLYWRGIVLGKYDGRTWTPLRQAHGNRTIRLEPRSAPVKYQITLEPTGRRWLFALEMPDEMPKIPGSGAGFTPEVELRANEPLHQRMRYDVSSVLDFRLQPDETQESLWPWLAVPRNSNPETLTFARALRQSQPDNLQAVFAALAYFRNQPFRYTMEPPLTGEQPIDDFMFRTRAGFCEHYSGAFVFLMRAMGIPARVVTGYQGGEINTVDGFMEVRQYDAHAWAEVWLPQRGWMRVDPTGAVAPQRIERNLSSAIPRSDFGSMVGEGGALSWLKNVRNGWNAFGNAWNQWVLNYTPERQKSFMRSLGIDDPSWSNLIVLLTVVVSVILGAIGYALARTRERIDPVVAVYVRLSREMAKRGLARAAHEGPLDYRRRLGAGDSPLTPAQKEAAARFLDLYQSVQYGVSDLARGAAAAQLKALLLQCR